MASGFEKRIGSLGHSDVDDVGVGTYYGDGGEVDTGQSDEGFVPSGEYSYDGSSSAHMPLRSVHEEQHVDQHQEYTRFSLHGAAPTLPSGIPEHPAQVNVSRFAHDPRSHRHLVSSPNESYWNSEGSYHIWPARSRTSPDSEHEEHPDYIKYSQFPGPQKYHSRTWQKPRTDQYCPTKRFREKYVLPRQSKCNQSSSRTYYGESGVPDCKS
ncbi:uncharacterized protein EI90DRAFT_252522 [Cantharellus anzutake]|uniref:uncharacterized protein n=1 Tax=Cantharellus anzutake TaxID=1750568 RepID=UPI00190326AC|nr:uncharacterized protein EI90DRAFT_252522 [Cantharellus anzutake]KAF8335761.1 hypothetical protein EI90DRAFT_252522 [Cantharellus anzutake]